MPRYHDKDVEYIVDYWRDTCRALMKQRRVGVVHKNGGGRHVLDYPQMGALLEVAMHADVWRAMYVEDALARKEASVSRLQPRARRATA